MSRRLVIPSVIVFVLATGFVLFLSPHNVRRVQAGFLGLISPLLKSGSGMEKRYHDYREGLKNLEQLEEENRHLLVSNKELSATNQTLRGYETDNIRLRKALEYKEKAVFKLMPARIVARDASTWYNKIIIDRGTSDGLKEDGDQAVLTEEGLVGKTTVVSEHSAEVVLISDEACRVAANVEGTREQGIVKGERASSGSSPSIGLNFLSKQANLKTGANIYTSGAGGVFPSGVLIGQVKEFKMRELDGHASVIPAVDLTTLEDVFVVVGDNK
ncbi:MAG TPA: rod shape-determining protein MreC [Chthoniobacter sp.]|jgi:rod shape-determining protein MreC